MRPAVYRLTASGSLSRNEEHPTLFLDKAVATTQVRPRVEGSFFRGVLIGLALSLTIWTLVIWALIRLVS